MLNESLNQLQGGSAGNRRREMIEYAYKLIQHDISHIQFQADMRKANSHELDKFLGELIEILRYYSG